MAAIVESIEISRRPEDVFSYATDFSHFPEWQGASCRHGGAMMAGAKCTIGPLDDGTRSRVTIAFDFEAHAAGRLLVPLVRREGAA
jgi:hypothetical protein